MLTHLITITVIKTAVRISAEREKKHRRLPRHGAREQGASHKL